MVAILYKADASPPARAVLMLMDILGVKMDLRDLDPIKREQDSPELSMKNPMRSIPLLDEGDYWLADSHAIMIYLIEKYGKPEHAHLYPADIKKRGTIHQRLFFDCGILFTRLRTVMAPTYAGKLGEMTRGMIAAIVDSYSKLNEYLSQTIYMADDVLTIADLSVVSTVATLDRLVPIDGKRFPKLINWYNSMHELDYCKRINIPGADEHADGLKALMANTKHNQKSKL